MRFVAVIGGSKAGRGFYKTAMQAGAEIAARKAVLICGGLGGVMEAACRGARRAGGMTVGILPGKDRAGANKYVKIAVATGMGPARNLVIVNSADGVLAIDGKEGTLSEIAFTLKQKKPIVGIGTYDIKGIKKAASAKEAVERLFKMMEAGKKRT